MLSPALDKIPLTKYKAIQLSIMPEITSLTLKNAFNKPVSADQIAAAIMAMIITIYHGQFAPAPKRQITSTAIEYCPEAPKLNKPAL